jgi:hypothetical protein
VNCRHCGTPLTHTFVDLGFAPPSNAYLTEQDLSRPETWYPLKTKVCDNCWLVQTEDYTDAPALFTPDYAYFSSTSSGWLEHARRYADRVIEELALSGQSHVIEVASNDGYLLKNFVAVGIPCLGIEPTASTGCGGGRTRHPGFARILRGGAGHAPGQGEQTSRPDRRQQRLRTRAGHQRLHPRTEGGTQTGWCGHTGIPASDAVDRTGAVRHDLPRALFLPVSVHRLPTICCGRIAVWKVEELPTHGGSLRVWGCHGDGPFEPDTSVDALLGEETQRGLQRLETYRHSSPAQSASRTTC